MNTTPVRNLPSLTGQWIGVSRSEKGQEIFSIVNIEERSPGRAQVIGIIGGEQRIAEITDGHFQISGDIISGTTGNHRIFNPITEQTLPLGEYYKQANLTQKPPTKSTVLAGYDGTKILGEYKTDLGDKGNFEYWRSITQAILRKPPPEMENVDVIDWDEFKKRVLKFCRHGRVYFRGQKSNRYPLRTAFHRTGRIDLFRYVDEDIPRLKHRINSISPHVYHATKEDYLGLLGVAQHHGFPTPLLDWTLSPYVAAFFAFDCLNSRSNWFKESDRSPVRIFIFDLDEWLKIGRQQAVSLKDPWPDLQFVHPPAYNNPRYFPQQSIAAFSNVYDIEGFILGCEVKNSLKCLSRFDIRADQRQAVEDELRFMGITAATLFPGFEGVCKGLRSELF